MTPEELILSENIIMDIHKYISKKQEGLRDFLADISKVNITEEQIKKYAKYQEDKLERYKDILEKNGIPKSQINKILNKNLKKIEPRIKQLMKVDFKETEDGYITPSTQQRLNNLSLSLKDVLEDLKADLKVNITNFDALSGALKAVLVVTFINSFIHLIGLVAFLSLGVPVVVASILSIVLMAPLVAPFTEEAYKSAMIKNNNSGVGFVLFNIIESVMYVVKMPLSLLAAIVYRLFAVLMHGNLTVIHQSGGIRKDLTGDITIPDKAMRISALFHGIHNALANLAIPTGNSTFPIIPIPAVYVTGLTVDAKHNINIPFKTTLRQKVVTKYNKPQTIPVKF